MFEIIESKFKEVTWAKGVDVYNTFKQIIETNNRFRQLSNISNIITLITGEDTTTNKIPDDLSSSDLVYFNFQLYFNIVVGCRTKFFSFQKYI